MHIYVKQSKDQNMEWPFVERPIFRISEITNIKSNEKSVIWFLYGQIISLIF